MLRLKTLFVEDEDVVARTLRLITDKVNKHLQTVQLEFYHASDVVGAIAAVNSILPDICIVDLNLNGESGLSVIEYIRANCHARVSVLSGSKMSDEGTRAWKAGATAFLEKNSLPELSKDPNFLKEYLREYLIALAEEQAKIIGQRFRVDLIGRKYKIGTALYEVGSGRLKKIDGKEEKLSNYDAAILNFFCKYPSERLTYEDLNRELGFGESNSVKQRMDVIVSRLRSKVAPHVVIEAVLGKGYRLDSDVELVPY